MLPIFVKNIALSQFLSYIDIYQKKNCFHNFDKKKVISGHKKKGLALSNIVGYFELLKNNCCCLIKLQYKLMLSVNLNNKMYPIK